MVIRSVPPADPHTKCLIGSLPLQKLSYYYCSLKNKTASRPVKFCSREVYIVPSVFQLSFASTDPRTTQSLNILKELIFFKFNIGPPPREPNKRMKLKPYLRKTEVNACFKSFVLRAVFLILDGNYPNFH